MVNTTRQLRRRAAAVVALLVPLLAVVDAAAQGSADHMLPAGRDSGHDYTVDPGSIQHDGNVVRFHLSGTSSHGYVDNFEAQVMVDCAHRTRRELGSEIRNQWVGVKHNGPDAQMREVFPGTRQDSELRLVCRLAGVTVAEAPAVAVAVADATAPAPAPAPAATATPAHATATAPVSASTPDLALGSLPPLQTYSLPARKPLTPRAAEVAPSGVTLVAVPEGRTSLTVPDADAVQVGREAGMNLAILVDSVHRKGSYTSYEEQAAAPGVTTATRRHYVVDCVRQLRAFQPEATAGNAKLWATKVRAGSLESRELTTACTMPEGPRRRWFAGFVVSPDGVVVAPHSRTAGCDSITMGFGAAARTLRLIAHEDDLSMFKIPGGGIWPVMPALPDAPARGHAPVTLMGIYGTAPRVSAAFAEKAGANDNDPGWPQVRTLKDRNLSEGIVWDASGLAIGLALAFDLPGTRGATTWARMLPANDVRRLLQRHSLTWLAASPADGDAETAMRLALSATVPLICNRNQ